MTLRLEGLELRPYVLGWPRFVGDWVERSPLEDTELLDVLAEENRTFFRLLNAGNALAYTDIAMPDWVQLDCATLPTAMIGFALGRSDVPVDLWQRLERSYAERFGEIEAAALSTYDGLVPVSEWCGVKTPETETVFGFSLFSLLPGHRLGVRSKALGLLLMNARRQVGVTRRAGPTRRTHETFGSLNVLHDRPAPHPEADKSLVYEIAVPTEEILTEIVRTGRAPG